MWLLDLETVLVEESLVVSGDILLGTSAKVPTDGGTYISIIQTGGMTYERTHDSKYERPGAQITVRSENFVDSMQFAMFVHAALDKVTNRMIGDTWYKSIRASQMPADLGSDDTGRAQIKFNVIGEKLPEGVS